MAQPSHNPLERTLGMSELVPEKFQKRFEELQYELHQLQATIAETAETAFSEDNLVAATVGARGELRSLQLDPRIFRNTDADALAQKITETIWDATRAVTDTLVKLTRPLVPEGQQLDLHAQLQRVPDEALARGAR